MRRFLLAVLLILVFSRAQVYSFPEAFGLGYGPRLQAGNYAGAVIFSYWDDGRTFIFAVAEKTAGKGVWHGRMIQIAGDAISSYGPFSCSSEMVYCYERQDKSNWHGAIDYRGHYRPFCGGDKIKNPCGIWRHDG